MILNFVGLASATYYYHKGPKKAEKKSPPGRSRPGYSYDINGEKVPDAQIKEYLCELVSGDGYPYGYKKLQAALKEEYELIINHKKVLWMCQELEILRPQRTIKPKRPKKVAKKVEVDGPGQLWQLDVKYGYISGQDQFFFQLSLIDVFDRDVIAYHIGLSCTGYDAVRVLKNSLKEKKLAKGMELPRIRTDNGPQFISNAFTGFCEEMGITHERIPIKSPNMIAYIESFHSILEEECYTRNEFESFLQAYSVVTDYMKYYCEKRIHGSLNYMAPRRFNKAFLDNQVEAKSFSA